MFNFIFPKITINIEKWKYNKYFDLYVSNQGNFRDNKKKPLPIKVINKNGYCAIMTKVGLRTVHRVVMLTWKPVKNADELTIDHLDHNKRHNSIKNLEWVTSKENLLRSQRDFISLPVETYIKAGNKKFNSFKAAAKWCLQYTGNCNGGRELKVQNKIKKAIATKTKYCNLYWIQDTIAKEELC